MTTTTTFTASKTSVTRIYFPRPIDLSKDIEFRIQGDGRFLGFIMRKTGDYEQEGLRPVLDGTATGACARRGCEARSSFVFISGFNVKRHLTGTWNLYVIADGAPVNVSFVLKGSSTRRFVPVEGKVDSEIRTLPARIHESSANTTYSAGAVSTLGHVDYGMLGLWTIGAPHGATAYGECLYYGHDEDAEEPTAFLPGCPSGDGEPYVWPLPGPEGGVVFTSSAYGGTRGVGGWYTTASLVERFGAVAFWIDF